MSPIERLGASSSSGVHLPLASFQTPPSAAPAYRTLPSSASDVVRPPTRPAPPPEFDHTGSRYPCASLSYGFVVISLHAPPDTGRFLAAAYAPLKAPGSTSSTGAVRASAY